MKNMRKLFICIMVFGCIVASSTWLNRYMSGELHISQSILTQLDVELIAVNYEELIEKQDFIDAHEGSFESLPFGYEVTESCISIARSKEGRLVAIRIYPTSRNINDGDNVITYHGRYDRMGLKAPMGAWTECTTRFVLESNRVTIAIFAVDNGNPEAKAEDDLQMIMDTVSSTN